mmetsp:Transcript_17749/g.27439  ORF Transcript_17749/g.27439 Transcript_17749/m.27439 type:complete len:145 (+) Transcript_17749:151-585(+)
MELTYWTSLLEPKKCVRDPYGCDLDQYIPRLEGDLVIRNVKEVNNWRQDYSENENRDKLDLRLAFRQELKYAENEIYSIGPTINKPSIPSDSEGTYDVYDVLRFVYKYNKDKINLKEGWSCDDGFVQVQTGQNPNIEDFTMDTS